MSSITLIGAVTVTVARRWRIGEGIRVVNEMRQIASYSRSTRSRLDKYSDRMDSSRARARLEFLMSRNELLDIRLENLFPKPLSSACGEDEMSCYSLTPFFLWLFVSLSLSTATKAKVPAIIVFGDSFVDSGNKNLAIPAYLDPAYNISDFATGVCFASAGTGYDNATSKSELGLEFPWKKEVQIVIVALELKIVVVVQEEWTVRAE
ncbi:hypothetical protein F3Y22_tig00111008pilonHSYRG00141 [Hibiscus syriacus]|uniref:GDSL esterase/lipase n=1 Tax=Hibiscus syriacus TaxID=106335 RepID=A0A6A2Z711_HIBSY|nr:hypothetical protein F3Y22_tig00111008pilonHSYRG00141 [Hibiscus syriacus]